MHINDTLKKIKSEKMVPVEAGLGNYVINKKNNKRLLICITVLSLFAGLLLRRETVDVRLDHFVIQSLTPWSLISKSILPESKSEI